MKLYCSHLVDGRHFGSFVQQKLHDLNVPHLGGFDQRSLSILRQKTNTWNTWNTWTS